MIRFCHIGIILPLFLLLLVNAAGSASSSSKGIKTSIKRYTIFKYHENDILCEPYVVKKDDWLYKIFRKKGEISEKDFPHFLDIFKELNANISNIDAIEPGQNIMIPLKKVKQEDFTQTQPGILDIPVIEYATMPDSINLDPYIEKYQVQKGDTVSELIDKAFRNSDGAISKAGINAFKVANPHVKNIDLIYAGSYIHLPDPAILSQSWFQSLFSGRDLIVGENDAAEDTVPEVPLHRKALPAKSEMKKIDHRQLVQLNRYAAMIGGTLKRSGKIYFPRKDNTSYALDLEAFPIIETRDGKKILLVSEGNVEKELLDSMKSYWKHLRVEKVSEAIRQEQLLAEQEKTMTVTGVITPLMDNHHIVKKLLSYSAYDYIPEADIPFTFNDVTLTARFGRIVRRPLQPDILINFGDVYGFALDEIRKKEFEILLIQPSEAVYDIAQKIFSVLGFSIWENPTFKSENGGVSSIPGLYFFKSRRKLFLTLETLDYDAMDHLNKEDVKLVKLN